MSALLLADIPNPLKKMSCSVSFARTQNALFIGGANFLTLCNTLIEPVEELTPVFALLHQLYGYRSLHALGAVNLSGYGTDRLSKQLEVEIQTLFASRSRTGLKGRVNTKIVAV